MDQRSSAAAPSTWRVLQGCAGLPGWVTGWNDDRRSRPLQGPSVSRRGHRSCCWLYFRFPLGLRIVEELLAARGIIVSHETVRQWARKFGQQFANQIRRRLPRAGDKWHLDEVVSRSPA